MATTLSIRGMTCLNCARHVREAISVVPGVTSVEVNLQKDMAVVAGTPSLDTLLAAVKAAGYEAKVFIQAHVAPGGGCCEPRSIGAQNPWSRGMWLALAVAGVLMGAEWFTPAMHQPWFPWVSFALVLPVMVFSGGRFFLNALRQLRVGKSNMDTLVALGSGMAFGLSVYGLVRPGEVHHVYFMEAAGIIGLISLGHWLEARVSSRAASEMSRLLHQVPEMASIWEVGGNERIVPVAELAIGQVIVIRPGERVPVDAVLLEGNGAVDESLLTGESTPVEKSVGSTLLGGSLNQDRLLIASVQAVGERSALARIVALVEQAQGSHAAIARLADKISSLFVPLVVGLALFTIGWWILFRGVGGEEAILHAVGVLIIACPCAMGLAAPAALMVAANVAARRGMLLRGAEALEKCGRVTTVLFDKTGTLTESQGEVRLVESFEDDPHEVASFIQALVGPSRHPVSRMFAKAYEAALPVQVFDWQEVRGCGARAEYYGETLRLGSLAWLQKEGVLGIKTSAALVSSTGLSRGSLLLATFQVNTRLKSGVREMVQRLQQSGLNVGMVTGDQRQAAEIVAAELGLPMKHVHAGVRPEDKAQVIKTMQERGEKVAFVGDGINDGPALAISDLGIAVMGASDLAKSAADIILLRTQVSAVPEVLGLAQATLRTIQQNFVWALVYNAAAIPLAMIGEVTPVLCAAAMGLSDLCLILNCLRLYGWKMNELKG